MARAMGKALSGLKKPGKIAAAPTKKGTATMTIEPLTPAAPKSESIAPPKKLGMPSMSISPNPKAGPGWKAQPGIAHPGDTTRPTAADITKA